MPKKVSPLIISLGIIIVVAIVVVVTALLVPQELNPAYAAAVEFVNAAGKGDDDLAMQHLSADLQTHVQENCADGSVSACIASYTPPEWGEFLNGVFRRAQPDGADAWDIVLLATYAEDEGFSGVCIYNRAERVEGDNWEITRWAGWISCDDERSGLSEFAEDAAAAPNSAPAQ